MNATTTDPITDLINYLRSLEAEKLRRLATPAPKQNPPGFFGFIAETPVVTEQFGTPLFTVLPPL
jgi:hypothetical protein